MPGIQKIALIINREYRTQIQQKSFKIMIFLAPIAIIGVFLATVYMNHFVKKKQNVAIINESHFFFSDLESNKNLTFSFFDSSEKSEVKKRLQKDIDALLIIPKIEDLDQLEKTINFYSLKSPSTNLINDLQQILSHRMNYLKLRENGVEVNLLAACEAHVELKKYPLKGQTQQIQQNDSKKLLIGGMMYLLMMFIIIYGVRIMRSVLEEKNNRIVEIIISSVQPFELMIGKILGTAFVALTQFTLWILIILIAVLLFQFYSLNLIHQSNRSLKEIYVFIQYFKTLDSVFLLSMFCIYFIGGYLLFSSFFAAIGASMENESDTQQYSVIGSTILIIAFYGGVLALNHPDSSIVFWLSIIPLTSPITMLGRLYGDVSGWQVIGSLIILGISIYAMSMLSAKIYRLGILSHKEKPSLKNIINCFQTRN